jgi:hypothetical protein
MAPGLKTQASSDFVFSLPQYEVKFQKLHIFADIKQPRQRSGVAQRVPGGLGSQIS